MEVRVRNVKEVEEEVNNNNNNTSNNNNNMDVPKMSKGKRKPADIKERTVRELKELSRAAVRLMKGQGSPVSYLLIPALISLLWLGVCLLTTQRPSLTLEDRLSQKHFRDFFENQANDEGLLLRVHDDHHEHVVLPEGESINIILAMPFLDINPLGATEYISTMEWILIYSTVPITFHIITNDDSIEYVHRIFERVNASTETDFKHSIMTLNTIMDSVTDEICPMFKASEDFCDVIMGKMTPLLFPYLFKDLDHAVYVDRNMRFQDDVGLLYTVVDRMKKTSKAGLALAPEQTNTYMKAFSSWQRLNPSTKLGRPPPDGKPGYNPDLMVMDLEKLRASATYRSFFGEYKLKQLIKNYLYLSEDELPSLGDAVNIMAAAAGDSLFYPLGCEWNRNSKGSSDVLERQYNVCPDAHHIRAWNGNPNMERLTQAKENQVSIGKRRVVHEDDEEL